ncbi:MAG: acetate/propionate family kinase [Planctomycetia bacterium]|nr:acetate/propionate family kinase [Planctomycetia bacterium]
MASSRFHLLTINTGSSSLKAAVFGADDGGQLLFAAEAQRVGLAEGRLRITAEGGDVLLDREETFPDHGVALRQVLAWIEGRREVGPIAGVGHRIVHGGPKYAAPHVIDAALLEELRACVRLAPNHLPQAILAIEVAQSVLGTCPQVACFDTGFHRTLPRHARLLPLPRELAAEGVVRYGFHGLSYEYLVDQLRTLDPANAGGRAVLAHLGNGASMAAVNRGACLDTSMGFTPAGGLVMGTRTGDLDPGVLVYLLETKAQTARELARLVNHQAGLLGVSGRSADMRDLLAAADNDPAAAEAIDLFCYQARKFLGGYAAALGGLDTLVFTGGIGENAPPIRERICGDLEFLGVRLDSARNKESADLISTADSRVSVRVIKTDEDRMIARHTKNLLFPKGV